MINERSRAATQEPTAGAANRRPFVAFGLAETFSLAGTRLSMIAIPWLVLTTTGSAGMTGLVSFAEMLPYVITKTLAGPIVDRIGAKPIAVIADAASVLVIALVPILHTAGALHIAVLVPIVAIMGSLRGPSDGAKETLVPQVAELAAVPLERVTGVHSAIERLATTVGAAAAGGLVALLGPASALALNAGTFAVAAAVIMIGVPRDHRTQPAGRGSDPGGLRRYLRDLNEGWRFLRTDAVLVGMTIMVAITNLLDQAFSAVMIPVWAKESGHGALGIGLFGAFWSGASVLGAVLAAARADKLPRLAVYTVAFLIAGAPRFVIFAVDPQLAVILGFCVIGGFASGFINPILGAVIFERIPKPLVGRVSTLNSSLAWSLIPFGGLLGGVLIAGLGLPVALLTVGGGYFLTTLMPLVRKSFREFAHRPEAAADPRSPVPRS
ncbi:MAG TPA: MFS transporter [Microlunatus sp.]